MSIPWHRFSRNLKEPHFLLFPALPTGLRMLYFIILPTNLVTGVVCRQTPGGRCAFKAPLSSLRPSFLCNYVNMRSLSASYSLSAGIAWLFPLFPTLAWPLCIFPVFSFLFFFLGGSSAAFIPHSPWRWCDVGAGLRTRSVETGLEISE